MKTKTSVRLNKVTSVAACLAALTGSLLFTGCGKGMNGTYAGGSGAHFEQIIFKSNGKAELTAMMGSVSECAFEVDGKNVKLMGGGGAQVLKMGDDGSLDGGDLVGKYYLVGKDPARMHGTYTGPGGAKFVFKPDGHAVVQLPDAMLFGSYTVAGSKLTLTTDKSFSNPSQTLEFKIADQKTLEGKGGQSMRKQ